MTLNILVTGGAGYIGSHVCKALQAAGYNPVTFDNLFSGHRWAVNWGPFEYGDIMDQVRLKEVMQKYRPEAVIHMAGRIEVGESVRNPGEFWNINVKGTLNLLEAMEHGDVSDIVFSSTCAIFRDNSVPITELDPIEPISPYAKTKAVVETILKDFFSSSAINSVSLRFFNAAGASADATIGEAHHPETHLIPLVCEVALGQRETLSIYGDDYPTPDGTCIRDYVHVEDIANAHLRALKYLKKVRNYSAFNLGSETGYSVRSVIDAVCKVSGKSILPDIQPRRAGDSACLVGSNQFSKSELGWAPEYQSLNAIVKTAWEWHVKQSHN